MVFRSILIPLFCVMGSTAFAQHEANEAKIYIPQNAIKMEAGKIIIGKNGVGLQVKGIHSNKHGFYIYKNDTLLQGLIAKGYVYGCTKCPRVFYDYNEAADHAMRAHSGHGRIYIKRRE